MQKKKKIFKKKTPECASINLTKMPSSTNKYADITEVRYAMFKQFVIDLNLKALLHHMLPIADTPVII